MNGNLVYARLCHIKNSYDCGIHAIVKAFAIINRLSFPTDIPQQKIRNW